jgi:hypothetical protein
MWSTSATSHRTTALLQVATRLKAWLASAEGQAVRRKAMAEAGLPLPTAEHSLSELLMKLQKGGASKPDEAVSQPPPPPGDGAVLLAMLRAGNRQPSQQLSDDGSVADDFLLPTPGSADAPAATTRGFDVRTSPPWPAQGGGVAPHDITATAQLGGGSMTDFRFEVPAIMREYSLVAGTAVRAQ